jgi:hypothetical protein
VADQRQAPVQVNGEAPGEVTGFGLRGGLVGVTSIGPVAGGLPSAGVGAGFDFAVSLHVSRHIGFEAGAQFSLQSFDCDGCSFHRRSIPTKVEFVLDSRKRGLYAQLGASWFQAGNIVMQGPNGGPVEDIATLSTTLGAIGALGYRIPLDGGSARTGQIYRTPSRLSLDIRLQGQTWVYTDVDVPSEGVRAPIDPAKQERQVELGLAVAVHWTP